MSFLRPALMLVAAGLGLVSGRAKEIVLPAETVVLAESALPGYALASAFCYTCHSVDYIAYQPPGMSRTYWKTLVLKMQKTFGAPVPDQAVEPIVDYLAKNYGAERGAPSIVPVLPPAAPSAEPPKP